MRTNRTNTNITKEYHNCNMYDTRPRMLITGPLLSSLAEHGLVTSKLSQGAVHEGWRRGFASPPAHFSSWLGLCNLVSNNWHRFIYL